MYRPLLKTYQGWAISHYVFLRRNTNVLKDQEYLFFFIVYRMSELFLTSHDVHTSSNEVQDRVVSARSASGPLGMTVSRRRWRVITGYEENEFRRRYWTDSVWQRSINYPEGNDFWFSKKKKITSKSKTLWDSLNERHLVQSIILRLTFTSCDECWYFDGF